MGLWDRWGAIMAGIAMSDSTMRGNWHRNVGGVESNFYCRC